MFSWDSTICWWYFSWRKFSEKGYMSTSPSYARVRGFNRLLFCLRWGLFGFLLRTKEWCSCHSQNLGCLTQTACSLSYEKTHFILHKHSIYYICICMLWHMIQKWNHEICVKKKQDEEKSWWSVIFHYSYDRCKMMCKAVGLH